MTAASDGQRAAPLTGGAVVSDRRVGERATLIELDPTAAPDLSPQHAAPALNARLHP
jgi:hypothetical protein